MAGKTIRLPQQQTNLAYNALCAVLGALVFMVMTFFSVSDTAAQEDTHATSLQDALTRSYTKNPTLIAAREELKAVAESVPQALSGWRPSVSASANHQFQKTIFNGGAAGGIPGFSSDQTTTNQTVAVTLMQPVFRGLRTVSSTSAAENTFYAQQANFANTGQNILLETITAFMDVVKDEAVVKLRKKNESVLVRHLEATRERFDVGEVTRTDVRQAESRLSGAVAERINAEARLSTSRARLEQLIGTMPTKLLKPKVSFHLPETLDAALEIAAQNNPVILAAQFADAAAKDNVKTVRGELLPEINLQGTMQRVYDPQFASADTQDTGTVVLSASIPLYQSGAVSSRVRQAKVTANQRHIQVSEAKRLVRQQTISAWENLQAARASIRARRAQVEFAELALDGVQAENQVGARTVLDVLDAEQELLDTQVSLVGAERDEVVASFALASALGRLTPEELGLEVDIYDGTSYFNHVRNKWYGFNSSAISD